MALALAFLVGAVALADTIPGALAAATGADDASVRPAKALGRVFFSESGWASPADQHLIVAVYERRVELRAPRRVRRKPYPYQLLWMAKRYSTKTFAPDEVRSVPERHRGRAGRSRRQTWLNAMGPSCAEPTGWPTLKRDGSPHPPWRVYEPRCQILFKRARSFVRRQQKGSCSSSIPVDHWGGAMDDWRAERNGWVRVADWSCVEDGQRYEPKNHGWCDPGLSECRDEAPQASARTGPANQAANSL